MIATQALSEIQKAYELCQKRYLTIRLPFEAFVARIEEVMDPATGQDADATHLSGTQVWLQAFSQLHHQDLFLATACARGDRIAWEYFADEYLPLLQRMAAQSCKNFHESEDLSQEIVSMLLGGGEANQKTKLASYNGRGSLAGWLRVTVARAAIDRFRRSRKQVSLEELEGQGQELVGHSPSPAAEEAGMDSRWGPVLSRLLAEEVRRLPARERLLLHLYYLQEVPLKVIGQRFSVHEATASRWLETIRRGIRKRVERELKRQHGLRTRDLQFLWRSVSEEHAVSLEKLLTD